MNIDVHVTQESSNDFTPDCRAFPDANPKTEFATACLKFPGGGELTIYINKKRAPGLVDALVDLAGKVGAIGWIQS